MQIQLTWNSSGERCQSLLETPVAIGRQREQLPELLDGVPVSKLVLDDEQIEPYHASIVEVNGKLVVESHSGNSIRVNGVQHASCTLFDRDSLSLSNLELQVYTGASIASGFGKCDRMVGFLFKRRCDRSDPRGCSYCRGGTITGDPYEDEYAYYPGYGRYDNWGRTYYRDRHLYYYDREADRVEFTEADAVAFDEEMDSDFEQNFGES